MCGATSAGTDHASEVRSAAATGPSPNIPYTPPQNFCARSATPARDSPTERRSIAITANAPFSEWEQVFPDNAMTLTAVDRLIHHATTLEMYVESYRRQAGLPACRQRSRIETQ